MNFSEIEKQRIEIAKILPKLNGTSKVLVLYTFYNTLLKTDDNFLIESFAGEFADSYLESLKTYSPHYFPPEHFHLIVEQIKTLSLLTCMIEYSMEIKSIIHILNDKLNEYQQLLNGQNFNSQSERILCFPLIGSINLYQNTISFSTIEEIRINIKPKKEKDTFIFVPSNSRNELIETQAFTSFSLAKKLLQDSNYKFNKHHEVLIYFDNLNAEYDGNSLGIALTIGFIEQLSTLYNLPYITSIKGKIVTSGGVDSSGNIIPLGKEIAENKTKAVFYSDYETFIIPKTDEQAALQTIEFLNKTFPKKKCRIVAVESVEDLLERRSLIDFKKQSPVIRSARFIKTNWVSSLLFLIFSLFLIFIYVRDFDDNPMIIEAQENTMFVKNKSGRILWTREISYSKQDNIYKIIPRFYHILEDINNDGVKEVIVSQETFPDSLSYLRGRIACFSNKGKLIWQRMFKDTVQAKYQLIDNIYSSKIIGIVNEGKKKVLLCTASNGSNFPSAVFKLDALNGNRITGTLWNPGHIMMGLIRIKDDGKHEIVCNMYNNDYERTGIFGIDYDNLSGTTPYRKEKYKLLGLENAKLNFYLLVPNTDYNKFYKNRSNSPALAIYDEKRFDAITFSTYESVSEEQSSLGYEYKYRTGNINVVIISYFKTRRDLLVANGKLKPPYTDTPEYIELLKSQVLYWNGKEFVKHKDYKIELSRGE